MKIFASLLLLFFAMPLLSQESENGNELDSILDSDNLQITIISYGGITGGEISRQTMMIEKDRESYLACQQSDTGTILDFDTARFQDLTNFLQGIYKKGGGYSFSTGNCSSFSRKILIEGDQNSISLNDPFSTTSFGTIEDLLKRANHSEEF